MVRVVLSPVVYPVSVCMLVCKLITFFFYKHYYNTEIFLINHKAILVFVEMKNLAHF